MEARMKKLAIMLLVSCLLFVAISTVSAVDVGTFDEMKTAIEVNNENVTLSNDIEGLGSVGTNGIVISRNTTIDGNGHYIDAQQQGRFFNITNDNIVLTLKNITLKNGKATYGGAIYSEGDVNIIANDNVCFDNNIASMDGGAICSHAILNIISNNGTVTFKNNKATETGGAIFSQIRISINSYGNICFKNNTADCGAIYNKVSGMVNITSTNGNVTFENNNRSAIATAGNVIITAINVEFCNNTATNGYGGAISRCCNVTITANNVIFFNNSAKNGGAIYSGTGMVNITNAVFYGNNANNGTAIVLKDWTNSNLNVNYWGLNYKNKTSIINAGLIATLDENYKINGTVAPDNWILLNLTAPNTIATGINNTFELKFNILTDGEHNSTYNYFNSTMIVKLNCINGTVPEYVIAGKSFNYTSNKVGADTINVINRYSGEIITNVSFNIIDGRKTPTVNITSNLSNISAGGNITIKLPSDATGTVNVTVNGTLYSNKVLVNGTVVISIGNLSAGFYNVVVKYSGDGNYTEYLNSTFINIPKVTEYTINVTGKLNSSTIGGNINITLPVDANGNITIIVNDTSYNSTVVNGIAVINNVLELIEGNNTITVIYFNDNKYNDTNRNITFEVKTNIKSFKDLQDLIDKNTEIILTNDYVYIKEIDNGSLIINKNIIIDGAGYTLDGDNLVNIFKINKNAKLTLKNVKLENASRYSIVNNGVLDLTNVTSKTPIYNNGVITSGVKFIVISNKVTTYDSFVVVLKTNDSIPIINPDNIVFGDDQGHTYKTYIYYKGAYVCYVPSGITGNVTFNNVNLTGYNNLTSKGSLDITKDFNSNKVVNSVVKNIKDLVPVVKNTFKSNKEITNVVSTVKNIITKSTMGLNTILKSFNNKVMRFI